MDKNDTIRRYFDENSQKWYFSVVDVVGIITTSSDARNYWKVLKNRLKKRQNELVTQCNQLKMKANDGKFYLTDTADRDTMLKIIEIISKENIPSFEVWFDDFESLNRKKTTKEIMTEKSLDLLPSTERQTYPQVPHTEEEFMLLVDAYYTNDSIIIKAMIAGVSIDNIFLSATCKILTIEGKRIKQKNILAENYLEDYSCQELYWGKFSRSIELPYEIEIDKIEARESYGLLTLRLPMINKSYSRKIKVNSL